MGRFAKNRLTAEERDERRRRRLDRQRQIKGTYAHRNAIHGDYVPVGDDTLRRVVAMLDMPGCRFLVAGDERHAKYVEKNAHRALWQLEQEVRPEDLMLGYVYRRPDIEGPLNSVDFNAQAAGAFICERLQKQPNLRDYLEDLRHKVQVDGPVGFVVPNAHFELVNDHVNLFTEGTLIYNLVLAGWNCRDAVVRIGPRHIEVILRRVDIPELTSTRIDDIAIYTPYKKLHNYCTSEVGEAN